MLPTVAAATIVSIDIHDVDNNGDNNGDDTSTTVVKMMLMTSTVLIVDDDDRDSMLRGIPEAGAPAAGTPAAGDARVIGWRPAVAALHQKQQWDRSLQSCTTLAPRLAGDTNRCLGA